MTTIDEDPMKHIRREQITAGSVAVAVALLEYFVNEIFHVRPFELGWFVLLIGPLIVLFFFVMSVIGRIGRREMHKEIERREAYLKEPVPLKFVGIVNGLWLDAIWDETNDRPFQASVIELRSSRAEGFFISGDTYECGYDNAGNATVGAEVGHFRGIGPAPDDATVHIAYTGGEHGDLDWGAISYRFRRQAGTKEEDPEAPRYFDGDFFVRRSNTRRYVLGQKVKEHKSDAVRREPNCSQRIP